MLHYQISYQQPNLHWLDLVLTIEDVSEETTYLQLPAWRPGRYELGNFAKNIRRFDIHDEQGNPLPYHKVSKDRWQVDTTDVSSFRVTYDYYAGELNAGSTWLDEEQLYINFVNCVLYVEGRLDEPYRISLDLPRGYEIAGGLPEVKKHTLEAPTFYHLAESPMIASASLKHWQYTVDDHQFHLWFQGNCYLDEAETLKKFEAFTRVQMNTMRGFPAEDYHFLYHFLPYRAYHGVEHFNSTVISLGPAHEITEEKNRYVDFLGVSSHELFHTWNIIRIRPIEMTPYDYTRENYFPTGFVAEGITTYYGDLFLARSGVFNKEAYFNELNTLFRRHFDNFGRFNHSLADSSLDLWLDGYAAGIPDRKVSIYVKGALISLILDLNLRQKTQGEHSLDVFMQYLWDFFGQRNRGYSVPDLEKLIADLSGNQIRDYFERFVYGTEALEQPLNDALHYVGCELVRQDAVTTSERTFGFRVGSTTPWSVQKIVPDSPAAQVLSLGDTIQAVDEIVPGDEGVEGLLANRQTVTLQVLRQQRTKTVVLNSGTETYLPVYTIAQRADASLAEQEAFKAWSGCDW